VAQAAEPALAGVDEPLEDESDEELDDELSLVLPFDELPLLEDPDEEPLEEPLDEARESVR
jgi:hypothetical protein